MSNRSFKSLIEEELGTFPKFLFYAILEWIIIIILFIDGFLAFFSNQIAIFFDLKIPCLLCTRLDHVLVRVNPDFYFNDSICDSHKKNVFSLAYCHAHKKLSEIKRMCEGCLLSFATEKESDVDTYKSLIGILHKDLELLIDDERQVAFPVAGSKKDDNFCQTDYRTNNSNDRIKQQQRCYCCGELLKVKSEKAKSNNQSFFAPSLCPRISFIQRTLDLSHIKCTELPEDEDFVNTNGAMVDSIDDRTPSFVKGDNRLFGIPLSDLAQNSPRWSVRSMKKSLIDQNGLESEALDGDSILNNSILNNLKRQVRMDRKSLIDLYMELDEERSASAVAANNAMAMITRLQAEKAAVQMEALQYQRLMDEQAEYDQEALQSMNGLLVKREEEMKELEAEIEAYRLRYGLLNEEDDDQGRETEVFHYEKDNEIKQVSDLPVCSSNHEENLELMKDSEEESKANNGVIIEEENHDESKKTVLVKEITEITERLNAIESKGKLLQQISDVLDVSEGEAILLQISQNLQMLRSFIEMPSQS